jgi:AcrR family transcriptional regulator
VPRDAEETKRRIFEAARAEFADHGIAGARVDRIARNAQANKQLIYAYFGNKRELFELVAADNLARFLDEVPFQPDDLPSYAASSFDFYVKHPEIAKIGAWHSLEPGETDHLVRAIEEYVETRSRAMQDAQDAGMVDAAIPGADLLPMINALATAWALGFPERNAHDHEARAVHRTAVMEAVARMAGQSVKQGL